MNTYEEKKQARIERYKERSGRAKKEAESSSKQASSMASVIPFGQPILVGHHSEKRDRNFRNRIENKFRKSAEASDKADYWNDRAESAENNNAISSDDPEAITKLKEKIGRAQERQETMKAANKIIRKKISDADKITQLQETFEWKEETCQKIIAPDFCGHIGFPQYELTNNNANIRRMKERLLDLESRVGQETKEQAYDGFSVVENVEENRIQIIFPGKPSADIRSILKYHGFRWSPSLMAWQRQLNNSGRFAAEQVIDIISKENKNETI